MTDKIIIGQKYRVIKGADKWFYHGYKVGEIVTAVVHKGTEPVYFRNERELWQVLQTRHIEPLENPKVTKVFNRLRKSV